MMNHMTSLMGKVGLAPFVGSIHGGKVFSPENMLQAHEIITKAIRFSTGFNISEADSDLDELQQVGPGGSFLTAERTLKYFRSAYEESKIFPRWSLETWQTQGFPDYADLLKVRTLEKINSLKPLDNFADLMEKGEYFISHYDSHHNSIF